MEPKPLFIALTEECWVQLQKAVLNDCAACPSDSPHVAMIGSARSRSELDDILGHEGRRSRGETCSVRVTFKFDPSAIASPLPETTVAMR